jgi:hypothetical protein
METGRGIILLINEIIIFKRKPWILIHGFFIRLKNTKQSNNTQSPKLIDLLHRQ